MSSPQKLAIYYGWPIAVNGAWSVPNAAGVFADYDLVVFGAGLEDPSHGDHVNANNITHHSSMANTEVYGYITASDAVATAKSKIDKWTVMNIGGIFIDEYGYDYGNGRNKQTQIVDYVHSKSLNAFANAWDPDDAFSSAVDVTYNPNGDSSNLGNSDWYLNESYQIINGGYQTASAWRSKADKVAGWKANNGCQMAMNTTTNNVVDWNSDKWDYAYFSAVLDGLDAACWGEDNYSASSASLPFRTRKEHLGTSLDGDISNSGAVYERKTNVGIHVDASAHTVDLLLDNDSTDSNAVTDIVPEKLAVYYGWPSSVNATYTVAGAANVFADYDIVVFGAGLEDTSHGDHINTNNITNYSTMANTEVYGYIDTTEALNTLKTKIDKWAVMNLGGIFCDKFGFDYSNSRKHQNDVVDYIHTKSLKAFVNAWDPEDVFKKNTGKDHKLNTDDYYLAESYQIKNGGYETESAWRDKSNTMASYHDQAKMAMITTTNNVVNWDSDKWDYAYYSAVLDNLDAAGWGEDNYSATSASLPFRTRKEVKGSKIISDIAPDGSKYERKTNIGIHIDTSAHTVSTDLD